MRVRSFASGDANPAPRRPWPLPRRGPLRSRTGTHRRWTGHDLLQSGDHTSRFEIDDRVPVKSEVTENRIPVLVELRRTGRLGRLPVVLDRRGHEPEGGPARGLALLEVAVGERLRILRGLERVLHDAPLALEGFEALPPLLERRRGEDFAEDLDALRSVLDERGLVDETGIV